MTTDDRLPSDLPEAPLPSDCDRGLPSDRRPPPWDDRLPSDIPRRIILPSDLDPIPPRHPR